MICTIKKVLMVDFQLYNVPAPIPSPVLIFYLVFPH